MKGTPEKKHKVQPEEAVEGLSPLWEYLMNIKGMTYDAILKDQRTEDEVFDEMVEWLDEA